MRCYINVGITYQHLKNLEHDFKGAISLVKGSFAERTYSFLRLSENVSCLCTFIIHSSACESWRGNKNNHKTALEPCKTDYTHTVYGS